MIKFLKRGLSFVVIIPFVLVLPLFIFEVDGTTDEFYLKFATPPQSSLILGTSRAAQALQPHVFKEVLDKDIFNYAFTLGHSPYGETYLNSIKKKLNKEGKNGIFILTVDPWSVSASSINPNDESSFKETNRIVATTPFVNMKPNLWYIFNNLNGDLDKIINNPNLMELHEDGWLEVNVKMDSTSVSQRLESKVKIYEHDNLPNRAFSSLRFEYLKKTITYLNQYGKVYLVRLPMHKKILDIEERFMPDFNEKLEAIIPLTRGYLDMTPKHENYQYTDGNHIYKDSGELVSREIAVWIKNKAIQIQD